MGSNISTRPFTFAALSLGFRLCSTGALRTTCVTHVSQQPHWLECVSSLKNFQDSGQGLRALSCHQLLAAVHDRQPAGRAADEDVGLRGSCFYQNKCCP